MYSLLILSLYIILGFAFLIRTKWFRSCCKSLWVQWKRLRLPVQMFVIVFIGYMTIFATVKPPSEPIVPPMGLENTPEVLEVSLTISGKPPATTKDTPEMLSNPFDRNSGDGSFISRIVTNTALPWLVMPSNAVVYSGWTNYGVAEDTFWVNATNPASSWGFVYAEELVEGAHVSSSGTLSFNIPKGSPTPHEMPDGTGIDFLAPFHSTLSVIPPNGRFWHYATESNSVRFTWQNFFVGRDTNNAISFQAELFINGDYTFRYAFPLHFLSFTNDFVIGAQFGGVGETFAMNNYSNLADGVDIIWDLPDSQVDTDGDGTYDIVELYYGFDPKVYTPEDWDNDGLLNNFEYYCTNSVSSTNGLERLNARLFDSDGDKLPDIFEVMYDSAFNPLVAYSTTNECLDKDLDGDGLNNAEEMFHGTNPNVYDGPVYNDDICEVEVSLQSEDSSDYMMRTITDEGVTRIILSSYDYDNATIPYELNKVIDFKYSRNVESSEYYEHFSTVECTFDIQDYWKGFCYITNAVNTDNFYDPQTMVLDVQQVSVQSVMEKKSGGQNVNTNGVYIFDTILSVDNLTCNDTDLDYVSPCGIYPSVTPSATLIVEASPDASLPDSSTSLKVKPIDKYYTSYFEFSDSYAQTNDFYIIFYADHNGDAELPISNHFDFAAIELNDEISGALATVTIKEDGSTVFEGLLNMPSLDITYHTREIDIELPAVLNMKGNPIGEDYFVVDLEGTHCFIYDEYVDLTFVDNSGLYLLPWVSIPCSFNTKGMSLGNTELYYGLEAGSRCSTSLGDVGITASFAVPEEGEDGYESATNYTTVIALDMDVDSDNDNGYNTPDMDFDEEYDQETDSYGKIVKVYREDGDNDSIPNVEDMDHGGLFVPLVIQSHPTATTAKYKFDFDNDIRIWTKDGNSGERTNEFTSLGGDLIEDDYEYSYFELFTGELISVGDMYGKTLYVEGLTNGTQNISCEYILESSTIFTETVKVSVIDVSLVPDYDRDGVIGAEDIFRYSTNEVFRFWINDDDDDLDSEDSGDDNPTNTSLPDYDEATRYILISQDPLQYEIRDIASIDGSRDLTDFFPIALLGLDNVLSVLSTSDYNYILRQLNGALNVYMQPELQTSQADYHLYNYDFAQANKNADLLRVTTDGLNINDYLEGLTYQSRCVVLMEGRTISTGHLILQIKRKSDNTMVYSSNLPLSLSGVKDMYRTLDLRGGTSYTDQPANYPDSLCNDKNVFFLHGFKVTEEDSHGWNAEFFKRLYWSGSNTKFWGVTWPGDTGSPTGLNYHENAADAFNTASNLYYATTSVSNKTFIAHSLGNMVVSAAIEDYGLDVDKYFMLNCAVPSEAYKASLASTATNGNYMLNSSWDDYQPKTWASQWYELFESSDNRSQLTWRGRFANVVSNAYNYYSSGDEVLEIKNGMPGIFSGGLWHLERYAWHKQEIYKGTSMIGGTSWSGWGFHMRYFDDYSEKFYTVNEANSLSNSVLQTSPVFKISPLSYLSSNVTDSVIDEMLTMGVSALSYPAGREHITPDEKPNFSFDMESLDKDNGWLNRGSTYEYRWLHNDLKNVAYLYNYSLFDKLVDEGSLE